MKRIAFLILALAAAAIAEDADIERMAKKFETDVPTFQKCLDEGETNIDEILALKHQMKKMSDDDLDEDTKNAITRHGKFIACLLEQKEMMVESKLMADKILEILIADKPNFASKKDEIQECITTLNENETSNREDRALGLMMCITTNFDQDDDEGEK